MWRFEKLLQKLSYKFEGKDIVYVRINISIKKKNVKGLRNYLPKVSLNLLSNSS